MGASCQRRRGFTLVELLVVVGIIGILVALLFPALNKVRERGRRVKASGEIRELEKAWRMYYRAYDEAPPGGTSFMMDPAACGVLDGNNAENIRFMEMTQRQRDEGMTDPWGQRYRVAFTMGDEISTEWSYSTRVYPANAGR